MLFFKAIQAHTQRLSLARKRNKSMDNSKPPQKGKVRLSSITTRNRSKNTVTKPQLVEKNETDISLPFLLSEHFSSTNENNSFKMDQSFSNDKIFQFEYLGQNVESVEQMNVSSISSTGSSSGKVRPVPVIPAAILQKVEEDIRSPVS